MIQDIVKHKIAYSFLAVFAAVYLTLIFSFQTSPSYLVITTLAFSLCYFFWGVFHHLLEHSLQAKIVLEYFLVATLAVVIIATLLV